MYLYKETSINIYKKNPRKRLWSSLLMLKLYTPTIEPSSLLKLYSNSQVHTHYYLVYKTLEIDFLKEHKYTNRLFQLLLGN